MDFKPPEFYLERRKQKKIRRKKQMYKKTGFFALSVVFLIAFYFMTTTSLTEIVARKKILPKPLPEKEIIIATCDKMEIALPVNNESLTAVGFHQAFNPLAMSLNPVGKKVDTKKMNEAKARKLLTDTDNQTYVLMQRSGRIGERVGAVDIGSKPGSIVRSPVNGTVALVRNYKLYGYIDDYEIHILPKGYRDRHLVVIHVSNVSVKRGDTLLRGKTALAKTFRLSAYIQPQLKDYSKDKGDHVHLQVNKLNPNGECFMKDIK